MDFDADEDQQQQQLIEMLPSWCVPPCRQHLAEGGIPPYLKLLKEDTSPEVQITASTTLFNLANNQDRVRLITNELGVPIIIQSFQKSPIRV
ncbi:hypothetical protein L1887_22375 [Cichorium endivia]|nr:hypothetical protein L1887_22375 [Cichorium endivia]